LADIFAARRAEALGARLPPLLVAAERVASTVAQGVHGRRRVGQGDSFWQFRPYIQGDALTRIDWRQSARTDRAYVRETEWEAAQTVLLWRDGSASMQWQSRAASTEKRARADLLLLALASLLLRGGERVRLIGFGGVPGHHALDRLAEQLARIDDSGRLPDAPIPRHARVVLVSDFLAPLAEIETMIARLAAVPVSGHLLQVLDPAEADLPYQGRVRFRGLERETDTLVPRVEGIRAAYGEALARQIEGLAALCAAAGFTSAMHRTDQPPEAALLGLYSALAPS
jgi:uncharacterized protein (DUF58 family)